MNILLISALFLNTADAKKKKGGDETPNQNETQTKNNSAAKANVPSDGKSEGFAKSLLSKGLSNFSPDAEGLTYKQMTFKADNSFSASAVVEVMDEAMECVESGTWNMDTAESKNNASMNWTITSTDCPSRTAPIELRVQIDLSKNDVLFR